MILSLSTRDPGEFKQKYVSDSINPQAVILWNYQEWNYKNFGNNDINNLFTWNHLIKYINEKDCQLYVVNGDFDHSPVLYDQRNPLFSRIKVIHYPYYFLYIWHDRFYLKAGQQNQNIDYKYTFVSLNSKPHWYRCLQVDKLAKYQLMDKAAVSWNSFDWTENRRNIDASNEYDWKHWQPKIQLLDNIRDINAGWTNQIPDQYHQSFAHLVTEATPYSFFITEKTVPALRLLKPFIISSRAGIHKLLSDLGFLLYDEVFDYAFDKVEDIDKRFDMIAENLQKLSLYSQSDLKNLYQKIYPKLVHNQSHYANMIKDINKIDSFLIDLCENQKDIVKNQTFYDHYWHCKESM